MHANTDIMENAPLYQRVAEKIANRIYDGHWRPGEPIPNEFALADEFSVSQGTIRKSMSVVEEAGLVDRQQGRGTFVRKLSEERSYFHFFRLAEPGGDRVIPEPDVETVSKRVANEREIEEFQLNEQDEVVVIKRLRRVKQIRATRELVTVPATTFSGLATHEQPLPLALYPFYHNQFGIFVLKVDEYVSAVSASEETANDLQIEDGSPILEVERKAFDWKGHTVEMRTSQFRSDHFQYNINLK